MTIICYRDGVIAADTAIWANNLFVAHGIKIARRPDGYLFGGAGGNVAIQTAMADFETIGDVDDLEGPDFDELELMIVAPDGGVIELVGDLSSKLYPEFDAIGFGSEVAMGAMAAGATAEQAVAVAIDKSMGCGGDVVSLSHKRAKMIRRPVAEVLAEMRK